MAGAVSVLFGYYFLGDPVRRVLSAAVVAASVALATGCASAPPAVSDKVQKYYDENAGKAASATPSVRPVTFAAVGDSVTEANSPDFGTGKIGDGSWVAYASGPAVQFAGGWADGGVVSAVMSDHVRAVPADVLVIVAGTNDAGQGVPFEQTAANLKAIAATVGAKRVIVSAIPPRDAEPELATRFNAELKPFVEAQGWTFVDAMAGLRKADANAPGLTSDGVHPTKAGARIVGLALQEAIVG
jgi:lysophospholipase L1-like esterase